MEDELDLQTPLMPELGPAEIRRVIGCLDRRVDKDLIQEFRTVKNQQGIVLAVEAGEEEIGLRLREALSAVSVISSHAQGSFPLYLVVNGEREKAIILPVVQNPDYVSEISARARSGDALDKLVDFGQVQLDDLRSKRGDGQEIDEILELLIDEFKKVRKQIRRFTSEIELYCKALAETAMA